MKDTITLITTSTLAAVLFLLHWTDEITRGMEKAQVANLPGVAIVVVWLIGSLILGARRSGYLVMLLFGILGFGVLVLHMMGAGLLRGPIANTPGIFFWVFTALLLGVTSALSAILAAKGLWSTFRRRQL